MKYRKIGDLVYVRGMGNPVGTAVYPFTLPVGFRPPGAAGTLTPIVGITIADKAAKRAYIDTAGVVTIVDTVVSGDHVSFDFSFSITA